MIPLVAMLTLAAIPTPHAEICNRQPVVWSGSEGVHQGTNTIDLTSNDRLTFNGRPVDPKALQILIDEVATLQPRPSTKLAWSRDVSCRQVLRIQEIVKQRLGTPG